MFCISWSLLWWSNWIEYFNSCIDGPTVILMIDWVWKNFLPWWFVLLTEGFAKVWRVCRSFWIANIGGRRGPQPRVFSLLINTIQLINFNLSRGIHDPAAVAPSRSLLVIIIPASSPVVLQSVVSRSEEEPLLARPSWEVWPATREPQLEGLPACEIPERMTCRMLAFWKEFGKGRFD